MARARKATDMSAKHLTEEEKIDRQQEEELIIVGQEHLIKPPKWLIDKLARDEYRRLVKEYSKIEIVGNLDLNNIACYCNAYASYRKATKELEGKDLVITKPLPNGSMQFVENPLIKIQKNYAEEMRKFGAKCGLDIDSRLKAATQKTSQTKQEIETEFGDI